MKLKAHFPSATRHRTLSAITSVKVPQVQHEVSISPYLKTLKSLAQSVASGVC